MDSGVFEGVHYYIDEKNVQNLTNLKKVLKEGGGSREFYLSKLVTHVISDDPETVSREIEGDDYMIVHSDWAVMSLKCGAQLPTAPFESSGGKLFSDLVFCPSKLSNADIEKLCVMVLFHGGKMQRRLDARVTHLVTMETTGAKYNCALKHPEVKIVTPDWILDSIDADKKLKEMKYHPSYLTVEGDEQRVSEGNDSLTSQEPALASSNQLVDGRDSPEKPATGVVVIPSNGIGATSNPNQPLSAQGNASSETLSSSSVSKGATQNADHRPGGGSESGENMCSPAAGPEELLEGVVICFTDYQDCVEDDTLEKWKLVVRQHGGEILDEYDSSRCTHLLALHKKSPIFTKALNEGKCTASAHWLNDVLTEQKMFPPKNPIHFPTAFKWQLPNSEQYSMTLTNYTDEERELVKDMLRICGIPNTGHLSRENTHLICKRPEGKKYEKALEWGIKVVNSKFLADIIHNGQLPTVLSPKYTVFNQPNEFSPASCQEPLRIIEKWKPFLSAYAKLHPDLMDSTYLDLTLSQEPQAINIANKRVRSSDSSSDSVTPVKKSRRTGEKSFPAVLFTGINPSVANQLKQIILKLGGKVTENGQDCTHIVTPRIARTVKFLCGISVCKYVVTPKWVEECGINGTFLPEKEFFLKDPAAERVFGMDIATSLSRASRKKLLEGICVHATPSVQPPYGSLGEIIECAGGKLLTLAQVRSKLAGKLGAKEVIVLSTHEDIENGHCKEFTNNIVYSAELILTGILKQSLDYSQYLLS